MHVFGRLGIMFYPARTEKVRSEKTKSDIQDSRLSRIKVSQRGTLELSYDKIK